MPLIDFAPLRIPLHRRLETAAVALYYYSFFFGALLGTCIIVGLFFTSFYPLALLYLTWAYLLDRETPDHGGRRSNYIRKLSVWKYFRDYFPIRLIKTAELDPSHNYIFGYHPHGILCAGAFCNFATEATGFSHVFPGITPHLLPLMGLPLMAKMRSSRNEFDVLEAGHGVPGMNVCKPGAVQSLQTIMAFAQAGPTSPSIQRCVLVGLLRNRALFKPPLFRDYIMCSGMCNVTRQSCEYILTEKGPGNSVVIVVGGAEEAFDAHPGTYTLILKARKGFIKLALRTGASLVPVFAFGENDLFHQIQNPRGSWLRNIQERLQKKIAFAPVLFYGRGIFQYTFGLLPHRRPVNVVVGAPIPVSKVECPTSEQLDNLHAVYIEKLKQLFQDNKTKYNVPESTELIIY